MIVDFTLLELSQSSIVRYDCRLHTTWIKPEFNSEIWLLRLQLSNKIYTFKKTFAILIWEFLVKLNIVAINILYSVLIWKFKHSNAL